MYRLSIIPAIQWMSVSYSSKTVVFTWPESNAAFVTETKSYNKLHYYWYITSQHNCITFSLYVLFINVNYMKWFTNLKGIYSWQYPRTSKQTLKWTTILSCNNFFFLNCIQINCAFKIHIKFYWSYFNNKSGILITEAFLFSNNGIKTMIDYVETHKSNACMKVLDQLILQCIFYILYMYCEILVLYKY